ncbi:hypothetical protein [Paenibacillus sp. PCH8]|nr:hypothetical protein [Paenibacillus sp. PCH8]
MKPFKNWSQRLSILLILVMMVEAGYGSSVKGNNEAMPGNPGLD